MRYVLEGEWSGYRSSQRRVVHRQVITAEKKRQIEAARLFSIRYTDGTELYLDVREAKMGERISEIHGYDSLIADCLRHGTCSVAELQRRTE